MLVSILQASQFYRSILSSLPLHYYCLAGYIPESYPECTNIYVFYLFCVTYLNKYHLTGSKLYLIIGQTTDLKFYCKQTENSGNDKQTSWMKLIKTS